MTQTGECWKVCEDWQAPAKLWTSSRSCTAAVQWVGTAFINVLPDRSGAIARKASCRRGRKLATWTGGLG